MFEVLMFENKISCTLYMFAYCLCNQAQNNSYKYLCLSACLLIFVELQ